MQKFKDLTGKKFNKLLVISLKKRVKRPKQTGFYTYWNCVCECGEETVVSRENLHGSVRSCGCTKRESKLGDRNPMWKGESAGYSAIHVWVRKNFEKPEKCQNCCKKRRLDWASTDMKSGYKNWSTSRNREKWMALCRTCHMELDGRLKNLKQYQL